MCDVLLLGSSDSSASAPPRRGSSLALSTSGDRAPHHREERSWEDRGDESHLVCPRPGRFRQCPCSKPWATSRCSRKQILEVSLSAPLRVGTVHAGGFAPSPETLLSGERTYHVFYYLQVALEVRLLAGASAWPWSPHAEYLPSVLTSLKASWAPPALPSEVVAAVGTLL